MVNNINFVQGIYQIQSMPVFRAKAIDNGPVTVPDNSVSFKGAEALSNYNKPNVIGFDKSVLEVEPLVPTIIEPDSIDSIEGEKIYGSNGKLYSIVNRVGATTVIYKASPEFDNMITSITTIDKKTGKIIKKQSNGIEDGKYASIDIYECDPVTGERTKYTSYEDGKLNYASKTIIKDSGLKQEIEYNYPGGFFTVFESNEDSKFTKQYEFNKNKELNSITQFKNEKGEEEYSTINFYKGVAISFDQSKSEVLPNNMGIEILDDADVRPADIKPVDLSAYPDSIEGEKTFYSNGSLESVTAGDLVYNYSPEGDITHIDDGNKIFEVDSNATKVVENLGNGAVKTTEAYKDGFVVVDYKKGDYTKHLTMENGKPTYYREELGDRTIKAFSFNEEGMLVSAWGDDI